MRKKSKHPCYRCTNNTNWYLNSLNSNTYDGKKNTEWIIWVKNYVVIFVFEDAILKRLGPSMSLKCSSVLNLKTNDRGKNHNVNESRCRAPSSEPYRIVQSSISLQFPHCYQDDDLWMYNSIISPVKSPLFSSKVLRCSLHDAKGESNTTSS